MPGTWYQRTPRQNTWTNYTFSHKEVEPQAAPCARVRDRSTDGQRLGARASERATSPVGDLRGDVAGASQEQPPRAP